MNNFTDAQKHIVQTTFSLVKDADTLAAHFYARLFEIDPSTRALFKSDLKAQGQKLVQTIAVVVSGLDNLNAIVPAIQSLGRRHAGYGVTEQHWDSVGSALLWTLADAFGDAFTAEVHQAWAAAYALIATTAVAAQREALTETFETA